MLSGAARVTSMGCDLSGHAPAGTPVERWDEIPAPSADLTSAYRLIRERVLALVEEEAARA